MTLAKYARAKNEQKGKCVVPQSMEDFGRWIHNGGSFPRHMEQPSNNNNNNNKRGGRRRGRGGARYRGRGYRGRGNFLLILFTRMVFFNSFSSFCLYVLY